MTRQSSRVILQLKFHGEQKTPLLAGLNVLSKHFNDKRSGLYPRICHFFYNSCCRNSFWGILFLPFWICSCHHHRQKQRLTLALTLTPLKIYFSFLIDFCLENDFCEKLNHFWRVPTLERYSECFLFVSNEEF